MAAEGALSHSPGGGWACHSGGGATAAGKSNLALGLAGVGAIDAYMRNSTDSQKSQILQQLQEENKDTLSTTQQSQQGNTFVHKYGSLFSDLNSALISFAKSY